MTNRRELLAPFPELSQQEPESNAETISAGVASSEKVPLPRQKDVPDTQFDIRSIKPDVITYVGVLPENTTDQNKAQDLITQINILNNALTERANDPTFNRSKVESQLKVYKKQYDALIPASVAPTQVPSFDINTIQPDILSIFGFLPDETNDPTKAQELLIYMNSIYDKYLNGTPEEKAKYTPLFVNSALEYSRLQSVAQSATTPETPSVYGDPEKESAMARAYQAQAKAKEVETEKENEIKETTFLNPNDTLRVITPSVLGISEEQRIQKEQDRLEDVRNQRRYSIISKAGYDTHYNNVDIAEQNMQVYLPQHTIVREFTDDESTVVIKKYPNKPDEIIYTVRGTDPTSAQDLYADSFIAMGLNVNNSQRYTNAEEKLIRLKQTYPDANIILTGHSLGASIVAELSKKYDLEGHAFNIGSSPMEYLTGYPQGNNRLTVYHISGDPISISNSLGSKDKIITTNPNSVAEYIGSTLGHSIGLFLPERAMSYELDNPSSFWMLYQDTRTDFERAVKPRYAPVPLKPFQSTNYNKFPVQSLKASAKKKKKVFIRDANGEYVYVEQ